MISVLLLRVQCTGIKCRNENKNIQCLQTIFPQTYINFDYSHNIDLVECIFGWHSWIDCERELACVSKQANGATRWRRQRRKKWETMRRMNVYVEKSPRENSWYANNDDERATTVIIIIQLCSCCRRHRFGFWNCSRHGTAIHLDPTKLLLFPFGLRSLARSPIHLPFSIVRIITQQLLSVYNLFRFDIVVRFYIVYFSV